MADVDLLISVGLSDTYFDKNTFQKWRKREIREI